MLFVDFFVFYNALAIRQSIVTRDIFSRQTNVRLTCRRDLSVDSLSRRDAANGFGPDFGDTLEVAG